MPEPAINETIDSVTGLPQDVVDAIVTASKFYETEDRPLREVMIGFWKKLENYWHGIQRVFWDYGAKDWRRIDLETDELDPSLYDKIINIYRAHGESIISALSIKLPSAIFYPDDADVIEDVQTAKACSKIKTLIEKHNDALMIFIKSLFILYNCGVVAAYIYNRKKNEYGTIKVPRYGDPVNVTSVDLMCPACGNDMDTMEFKGMEPQIPEVMNCPQCQMDVNPEISGTQSALVPNIVGYTDEPKSRTCIEVFSPLFVYMPFYARRQEHLPYIRLRSEQHYTVLKNNYPNLHDMIPKGLSVDTEGKFARSYSYLYDSENQNLVTVDCLWLRPWAFECLEDKDLVAKIKTLLPNGCYAVIVKDKVLEAYDESLDEHWQITHHPLSNYLHADPLGKPLAPIQELRNQVVDLEIETFEHAIPETFADSTVLDFEAYKNERASPGMKFPVKPPMDGRSIGESFYTDKPATLSEETGLFKKGLDADGQFVSGSFPSIYGGPAVSGSKTAKEYTESRAMALQRLNITWNMVKMWWAKVMGVAVPLYIKAMKTDEKYVEKTSESNTGFTNIWIRQSEVEGKIGSVEADAEEDLPVSAGQIKDMLIQLMTLNSDYINEALYHPQNTPLLSKALGVSEFYIPGQDDRDKQFAEIAELLKSPPNPDGSPTIMPDMMLDRHPLEAEACRTFLISPTGLAHKELNEPGWQNVYAHFLIHSQAAAAAQAETEEEDEDNGDRTE